MEIDVGRLIAGKYELVRLLGRGSMGEVWVAHHKTLAEHVAVKLLTDSPAGDDLEDRETAGKRFLFEAQVAARLSRKTRHIVRVTDHGEEEGLAYLAMELLEGETLEAILARDGRAPLPTVVGIVTQVARALEQAHAEGVLHRDLKPANVFLTRDEEGQLLVKLLDFGIARAIHAHRLSSAFSTAKGLVFGTPSYMSPEQARASAKLDQRCDLWALATIAYEAIAGELPIAGSDTDELLKNLCAGRIIPLRERTTQGPPALDAFFRRAFSDAIGARYQTATALAQAFEAAAAPRVDDEALDVPPPSESSAPSNVEVEIDVAALQRRGRARLALVAAGALLVLFAAVGAAWRVLAGPSVAPAASTVRTAAVAASVPGTPGIPSIPSIPSVTLTEPSVPVSALPQAPARPPPAGRGPHDPSPTPPPSPSAPGTVAGPLVAPAPAPPPPPAPAPAPTASKKVDRSEVF